MTEFACYDPQHVLNSVNESIQEQIVQVQEQILSEIQMFWDKHIQFKGAQLKNNILQTVQFEE